MVGTIGNEIRKEYTAIGDSVNIAARLEGANKVYKTRVLMTEDAAQELSSQFIYREIDKVRVKGREEPIKIYELMGTMKSKNHKELFSLKTDFENALAFYRKREFSQALEMFRKLDSHAMRESPN